MKFLKTAAITTGCLVIAGLAIIKIADLVDNSDLVE